MWIIYKHTNSKGKYYIGQTKFSMDKRWKDEVTDAFNVNQVKYGNYLSNAIRKYGIDDWKHEVLEQNLEVQTDADDREKFWIAIFCSNQRKFGYNLTSGGGVPTLNKEVKNKISKNRKGKGLGKKSFEAVNKLRAYRTGRKHSKETREKMRIAALNRKTTNIAQ